MSEPYLILHKVRGEPAFDIAERMDVEGEEIWIIPTSGHRAYPYWHHELAIMTWPEIMDDPSLLPPLKPPDDWPDHYQTSAAPPAPKMSEQEFMAAIGITAPKYEKRKFV